MIRTILYATDLGLYAPYVLQHALALTRSFNAQLYVIHAVEPMGLFADSVLQTYLDQSTLLDIRSRGLSAVMASIEQRVLEGFNDEMCEAPQDMQLIKAVHVVQGDPPLVILAQAQKISADLLVIGSHSHGTTWETPLGRTAQRLVQLSESPVYLVPMVQHRGRGEL